MKLWTSSRSRTAILVASAMVAGGVAWAGELSRHTSPAGGETLTADAAVYRQHLSTLADPKMEGRAPGTEGHKLAAAYLQGEFERLGLRPAFPAKHAEAAGDSDTKAFQFAQPFEAPPSYRPGDSIKLLAQRVSYVAGGVAGGGAGGGGNEVTLAPAKDYNVLGYSASGSASGALAFAGYAITNDDRGYDSFGGVGDALKGKVALVLRFEPFDGEGKSQWADVGWSPSAGLVPKLTRAAEHGASAIILVNPPDAKDDRVNVLEDLSLAGRTALSVPIVMMTADAADALVRAADGGGRGLRDLVALANTPPEGKGSVIDLPRAPVSISATLERVPIMTQNVGAVLPGRGALAEEYVVVGGHYDHIGYGYFSSRDPNPKGKLHPGADDNASGSSGVLLAARKLSQDYAKLPAETPARSILFLGFSAEESGLNGSVHYCKEPIAPLEKHALMLNMDMIGRLRDGQLEIGGVDTAEGFRDWLQPYFGASGLTIAQKGGGGGPSDHATFNRKNIPVLFFFTGLHKEYHAPGDVLDLINVEGATQVVDLVHRIALDAALRPEPFVYTKSEGDSAADPQGTPGGSRVRFGIAPGDYTGTEKGVAVGEVFPNTPAAKAGVKANDLITHWNGTRMMSVEEWMPLLSKHKPGDEVTITVLRGGEEVTLTCTLVGRGRGGS
jgi:hypothetical protein